MAEEDDGISHGIDPTRAISMIMAAFAAIALYNIIELTFIIATTFKRRRGLYFWSFIVAAWSIPPYALGFIFKFFSVIEQDMISVTMIAVGWCGMVTGQSVVLYSRLHLVVQEPKYLRWVLAMIITDAIICHIPILVLLYGSNSAHPAPFTTAYSIYEKVQITIFFLQEVLISGMYIWFTWTALKPGGALLGKRLGRAMRHLIMINAFIVFLDLTLLATEYAGHYEIQTLYKAALYSAKLKLEFRILNQLVDLTKARSPCPWSWDDTSGNNESGAHGMDAFAHCANRHSQPSGQFDVARDYGDRLERGEAPGLPRIKDGIMKDTTVEIEHSDLSVDPDDDSDGKERQSLPMFSETLDEDLKVISTASSQVEFARSS